MFRKILPTLRSNLCNGSMISGPQSSEGVVRNVLLRRAAATTKFYHTSPVLGELFRNRTGKARALHRAKEAKHVGEEEYLIDPLCQDDVVYPTARSPFKAFDGICFKDLPIIHITATPNNTKISVTDPDGKVDMYRSCGVDGFKNSRKGSSVAAQTTAFVFGKKMVTRGRKTARVCLDGLGFGRSACLKGLELAGVKVVSLTDTTKISYNPPRPKKQRRL